MALQNKDGEYIVIEEVTAKNVTIRFHKDAEHRARYKSGTESKYENTRQEIRFVDVDLNILADPEKSVRDNNIILGYTALKNTEEFAESVDL